MDASEIPDFSSFKKKLKKFPHRDRRLFELLSYADIVMNSSEDEVPYLKRLIDTYNPLAIALGDDFCLGIMANLQCILAGAQQDIAAALGHRYTAIKLFDRIGDIPRKVDAMVNAVFRYRQIAAFSEALSLIHEAIALATKSELGNQIGACYYQAGMVYFEMSKRQDSIKYLLLSIPFYEKFNAGKGLGSCYSQLAIVYRFEKENEAALKYVGLALEHAIRYNNIKTRISCYGTITQIYFQQQEYEKAEQQVKLFLAYLREQNTEWNMAEAYYMMGKLRYQAGDMEASWQAHLDAVDVAQRQTNNNALRAIYMEMSKVKAGMGDHMAALEYYKKSMDFKDEIINTSTMNQAQMLNVKFDIQRKEQEARLLKEKHDALAEKNAIIQKEKEEAEYQRKRAEQSERYKQLFLANMSHEIRTPMNAIVGMTNLLLTEPQQEKNLRYLNAIKHSSDNLLVVINDILDLSKIEAGKLKLEQAPFDLYEQLNMVHELFELKAQEKKLDLVIHIDPLVPRMLSGDAHRLHQVLINLVGNAIKFTHKGKVALTINIGEEGKICFSVQDTGIGIPSEKQEHIFESFVQAESETTRQYGGTGLGLSISRQLVELMGGALSVQSVIKKGTVFTFSISLNKALPVATARAKGKVPGIISDLTGLKILVVEDNKYNQIVAKDTLERYIPDVHISIAVNGKEALKLLKAATYDIILMDVHMPVMDGYTATERIRKTKGASSRIPILALTASVIRAEVDRCLQCGMNGYIAKPFKVSDLLNEISRHVRPLNQNAKEAGASLKITDLSYLRQFTENSRSNEKKYIDIFLSSMPKVLDKLDTGIKTGQTNTIQQILHSIRPQLQFMGMSRSAALAEKLEREIKEHGRYTKKSMMTLNKDIAKAISELTALI